MSNALQPPICLHVPPLTQGEPADIAWGVVDGATGYRLERTYNGDFDSTPIPWSWENIDQYGKPWQAFDPKLFTWSDLEQRPLDYTVYEGEGTAIFNPPPAFSWSEMDTMWLDWKGIDTLARDWIAMDSLSVNAHIQTQNTISLHAKTAVYRVMAYNDVEESNYLVTDILSVTPRILTLHDDRVPLLAIAGERYVVQVACQHLTAEEPMELTFRYDPLMLQLLNARVVEPGCQTVSSDGPASSFQLLSHSDGELVFRYDGAIPEGYSRQGLMAVFSVQALQSGDTEVELS